MLTNDIVHSKIVNFNLGVDFLSDSHVPFTMRAFIDGRPVGLFKLAGKNAADAFFKSHKSWVKVEDVHGALIGDHGTLVLMYNGFDRSDHILGLLAHTLTKYTQVQYIREQHNDTVDSMISRGQPSVDGVVLSLKDAYDWYTLLDHVYPTTGRAFPYKSAVLYTANVPSADPMKDGLIIAVETMGSDTLPTGFFDITEYLNTVPPGSDLNSATLNYIDVIAASGVK